MTTRSFLLLAVAGCTLAGCAFDATADFADFEGEESIGVVQDELTTECAGSILRYKLNGKLTTNTSAGSLENQTGGTNADTAYYRRCTPGFSMTAGDRHFAKMVGSNDWEYANPGNLKVHRLENGSWTGIGVNGTVKGTSTEVIDWTVDVTGTYRVCAVADDTSEAGTDWIRLTSDRSDPRQCGTAGTKVDYCFGASSSNCDGCSTKSDGRQSCPVSVGSQMHDTCCAHNPLGDNCGGSSCNPGTSGTNCGWISNCSKEDDHAWNDGYASRRWTDTFDPTVPYYRPLAPSNKSGDFAYFFDSDKNLSKPCGASGAPCSLTYPLSQNGDSVTMTRSMKAPAGQGIWDVDAVNGWCASGLYGSKQWSVQGYWRECK